VIDISYIEDEVEQEDLSGGEPPEPTAPRERPRWHRWAAFGAVGALLVGLFALASARTQPKSLRSADSVSVGEVYMVRARFGQAWLRVSDITLNAATVEGDSAALFVIEGRGFFPNQAATVTAEACESGSITELGSWTVGPDGSFRFADTDPSGGTYFLQINGLAADPVLVLIGGGQERVLLGPERGCPFLT
jgi:hypothetical protein